ncbi:hypothetical protein EfmJHP10_27340 [Enterococcus faecium]|nr:hypothetical protein EfmJHP10_27340 [Enterococcus faecium]
MMMEKSDYLSGKRRNNLLNLEKKAVLKKYQQKDPRDNRNRPAQKKSFSRSQPSAQKEDFDSLMSSFLKDSDDRLSSLKRNTEGKRGGRGGRRS